MQFFCSLQKYQEMVRYVNDFMAETIDEMPLGRRAYVMDKIIKIIVE